MDSIPEDGSRIREFEVEILRQLEEQIVSKSIPALTACAIKATEKLKAELDTLDS